MKARIELDGSGVEVITDLARPIDIAIDLDFSSDQPRHFGAYPRARSRRLALRHGQRIPIRKEVTIMRYATPELVVVGVAAALVQGVPDGKLDNGSSDTSKPAAGLVLGLDD